MTSAPAPNAALKWTRRNSSLSALSELQVAAGGSATGVAGGANRFSRYKNADYDKILDEISPLDSNDPKFQEGAAKALGIYWRDTIDVPEWKVTLVLRANVSARL